MNVNEQKIIQEACGVVQRETGLRLEINENTYKNHRVEIDAVIELTDYKPLQFAAEIKKWTPQANVGALINRFNHLPMRGILVADYVNPNMGEKLKEAGVQYIDTAGNAYIKADPLYIYIKGNRNELIGKNEIIEPNENRAFTTAAGLKVIFVLLCNPDLVRKTYREIAAEANVALGTVTNVFNDFLKQDYIINGLKVRKRVLFQYKTILNKWVEMYPGKLKAKQFVGNFTATNPNWWREIDLGQYQGVWGGEVAAANYTNHLKPKIITVYMPEKKLPKLFKEAQLARDPVGDVRVYEKFWGETVADNNGYVDPVLAYAELIATGDERNLETAKILFDNHIDRRIEGTYYRYPY